MNRLTIDKVNNGFVVETKVFDENSLLNLSNGQARTTVFYDHYDLYQFILTHFKLKPDEAKNEQ